MAPPAFCISRRVTSSFWMEKACQLTIEPDAILPIVRSLPPLETVGVPILPTATVGPVGFARSALVEAANAAPTASAARRRRGRTTPELASLRRCLADPARELLGTSPPDPVRAARLATSCGCY